MSRYLIAAGVFGCAMLLLSAPALHAAMEPDNVAAEVERAANECRLMYGVPNTEAMLSVDDLNGDGGEDWVIDYSKLRCTGSSNPFCGTGGCSLQIFFWSSGSSWKSVFEETVQSYRPIRIKGRRGIEVLFGGAACGEPGHHTCRKTYLLQRQGLSPAP